MAGRPPKKKADRRDVTLRLCVTKAELYVIEQAVKAAAEKSFSDWARLRLLEVAAKSGN